MSFLSASDIKFAWELAFFLYEKCFTKVERAGKFREGRLSAIAFFFPMHQSFVNFQLSLTTN
jgi:hypothetical protein